MERPKDLPLHQRFVEPAFDRNLGDQHVISRMLTTFANCGIVPRREKRLAPKKLHFMATDHREFTNLVVITGKTSSLQSLNRAKYVLYSLPLCNIFSK